jgi:DNA-binding MarR family transcriptional regulator
MVALSEAPGHRIRMGELAGRLVFSPSRVTYQISSMVKRGLVRKQNCPDDGRGQEAVLTDEGLAALVAAAPLHLTTVRESFIDDLDAEELAMVTRVFARLGPRLRGVPATAV